MSKLFKLINSATLSSNLRLINNSAVVIPKCHFSISQTANARKSRTPKAENSVEVDWEADEKELEHNFDDHSTPAQRFIRQIRYVRQYLRKAKYELPKLKDLSQPFIPPAATCYSRFLKIEHLGEEHPLDNKSVLLIDLNRLKDSKIFNSAQIHKLLLICNAHHFRNSNQLRFSCVKYPTYEENKLYLAKLWQRIVTEVKDGKDMFSDIPLPEYKPNSTHNRLSKERLAFPSEWIQK